MSKGGDQMRIMVESDIKKCKFEKCGLLSVLLICLAHVFYIISEFAQVGKKMPDQD